MDKLKPVHQPHDSGRVYWVVGDHYTFKLTAEETNGALHSPHPLADSASEPFTAKLVVIPIQTKFATDRA